VPEGPEVETIRRSLLPLLRGRRLAEARVSNKKLREPTTARALQIVLGRRVTGLDRRGKLLLIDVEGERGLFVRLGMTGKLVVANAREAPPLHTHVRISLDAGDEELRYTDARRFGSVVPFADAHTRAAALDAIGPDGLSLTGRARALASERLGSTARSLKDALLDQTVVAGVGNIYAAEALFLARLSPFLRGRDLSAAARERLLDAVQEVLRAAVGRRGTSFSDYVDGLGVPGDNLAHLMVFQREGEPCRTCLKRVVRVTQGQRSTFFCPRCQRVSGLG
jgi:formamidopyrimidine-DNA glycosylase